MEEHIETFDGEPVADLVSTHVQNINIDSSAGSMVKLHLDLSLPPLNQIDDIKIIPELLKKIESIELERPE
ncbi:hypothetical protein [Limosilactobacillus reuteri]|uniref:hypothetical protein n=1 Tax=Limosilactobacillus reuteri TaxID=1598 RepID=UPI001E3B424B|nr:hypothetical protein [Limosilactobacillus reuteri]